MQSNTNKPSPKGIDLDPSQEAQITTTQETGEAQFMRGKDFQIRFWIDRYKEWMDTV